MKCDKCGAELSGEYALCPKCGNRLKKKSKAGIIIGIALPVVLVGIGAALYVSGYYKNIADRLGWTHDESVTAEADNSVANAGVEPAKTEKPQEAAEEIGEKPDEAEQFLASLSLEPVTMTMGETYQVELEQEIQNASWRSSDETIVKVTEGQLKAGMPGAATVIFAAGGREIPFAVTVNAFPDVTLAVNYSKSIEMNDTFPNVRWESSNPEIVSAEEGVITSLASGAAAVTAYIDEAPYSFEVVATTPDITTDSVRKIIGNTEQVSILGTNGKAEWKSDNTAIATVSDTGLITAEPTGAGQSTVVHAYIDGMEFQIDVAVEPIPQLSSTYKIYGHQDKESKQIDNVIYANEIYKNINIAICTNANETVRFEEVSVSKLNDYWVEEEGTYTYVRDTVTETELRFKGVEKVLNVADADYSDGLTYPAYHTFRGASRTDKTNYIDVYLVGTSQEADVLIQGYKPYSNVPVEIYESNSTVIYEACEDYGIIHIYNGRDYDTCDMVTVSVDGYQYQFMVIGISSYGDGTTGEQFSYHKIDNLPPDYMVEECSIEETVVVQHKDYSAVAANSKTYNPGSEWMERIGTKFVESLEDQAIEMAAGALLKCIFL